MNPKIKQGSPNIPSLAYRRPTIKHFGAARWIKSSLNDDVVAFTMTDAVPSQASSTGVGTLPSVQVLSGSDQQQWGSEAEIYEVKSSTGTATRLQCDDSLSSASRLTCKIPVGDRTASGYAAAHFEIIDLGHAGGPVQGWTSLTPCTRSSGVPDSCISPVVWSLESPVLISDESIGPNGGWQMTISFVNVDAHWEASFGVAPYTNVKLSCAAPPDDSFCKAIFQIKAEDLIKFRDVMTLTLTSSGVQPATVTVSSLFTNMEPLVSSIAPDKTSWNGTNLTGIFDQVEVNRGGKKHPITCAANSACQVDPKNSFDSKEASGFLYLVGNGQEIPLQQISSTGTLSPIWFTPPPEKPATGTGTKTAEATQPTQPQALFLFKNNNAVAAMQQVK